MTIQAIQNSPVFASRQKPLAQLQPTQVASVAPMFGETQKNAPDVLKLRDALVARQPKFAGIRPHIVTVTPDGRTISIDTDSLNFQNNIFTFNGPISPVTSLIFNSSMEVLKEKILKARREDGIENPRDVKPGDPDFDEDRDKITINLSSYGGQFFSLYSIIDTLTILKNNGIAVSIIASGSIGNEAAAILACGTPGYRGITSNTLMEVEQPNSWAQGPVTNIKIRYELAEDTKRKFIHFLSDNSHTGKSYEDFERDIDRTKCLDADDVVNDWGIADFIADT